MLPSKGLSGQLWVGSGFGEDTSDKGGATAHAEGELGCSDVPGWGESDKKKLAELSAKDASRKAIVPNSDKAKEGPQDKGKRSDSGTVVIAENQAPQPVHDDGTDDHLHHPLSESDSASNGKPGEPAEAQPAEDKSKPPTHADIQSLQESAEIAGKVVLLSRGGCGFLEKAKWVQRRGGVALIVGDTTRGAPLLQMNAHGDTSNITIPSLFTSHTTAHLLSSLIPPENDDDNSKDPENENKGGRKESLKTGKPKEEAQSFGPPRTVHSKATGKSKPELVRAHGKASQGDSGAAQKKGWFARALSAVGIGNDGNYAWHLPEDSRRPPSSGNIDWVLEEWEDDESVEYQQKLTPSSKKSSGEKGKDVKVKVSKLKEAKTSANAGDDFVIGVQDWRDPEILASQQQKATPRGSTSTATAKVQETNQAKAQKISNDKSTNSDALQGGSITPGSGEYGDSSKARIKQATGHSSKSLHDSATNAASHDESWLSRLGWADDGVTHDVPPKSTKPEPMPHKNPEQKSDSKDSGSSSEEHEGLWVTLTPAAMSTSPFFDTLLVLVVSPLVTLTFVYALLLLRSRIRRRRWRAPKSVVDRLPVRTYHTITTTTSSTTSSQTTSPNTSSPASPLLRSTPRNITRSHHRPRPHRDHAASPQEKAEVFGSSSWRKKYHGRQVECVVCLEEYIDGQSRVMSLPCGHEFHAECM